MEDKAKEWHEQNAHIPDDEIERDIQDTQMEIWTLQDEIKALEMTPIYSRDAKINFMKASAKKNGIIDRKEFIEKLQAIINYRKAHESSSKVANQ